MRVVRGFRACWRVCEMISGYLLPLLLRYHGMIMMIPVLLCDSLKGISPHDVARVSTGGPLEAN